MPTSDAQIEANRANSQLSTGPRTEEGKQASSANATKTGLTSAKIFVRPEERDEFDAFTQSLLDEFLPDGEFQNHLFDSLLHAAWNIRRCIALEEVVQNEAIAKGAPDAMLDDELSKKLDRLHRYKKMHESAQSKAVAELRKLQTEQAYRDDNGVTDGLSILTDLPKVDRETSRTHLSVAKLQSAQLIAAVHELPTRNEAKPAQDGERMVA